MTDLSWHDLKIGDFVETQESYYFCFFSGNEKMSPSCMGKRKNKNDLGNYLLTYSDSDMKYWKPTKSFIKLCKRLLKDNLKRNAVDNLSYIEALCALKKYDSK